MGAHAMLTGAGIPTREAAALTGMAKSTMDRRSAAKRCRPTPVIRHQVSAANALSAAERATVLATLNSEEFVDCAPAQVYATLLARGVHLCSTATMYRILRANDQVAERRRTARHRARVRPELVATAPGQVYTWDITKLAGPVKGAYFDAYVMVDIYSRYIVGATVHPRESGPLAVQMMREIFGVHGIPHVVHADRGTSMTSKTVADLLEDLAVTRSHSRPRVSNDNPYSEALFKTAKYSPTYPERFATLKDARAWMADFTAWYNYDHHHSGIGFHLPTDVHHGRTGPIDAARAQALAAARAAHPERFAPATTLPAALRLPDTAWINPPEPATDHDRPATAA